MPIDIIMPNLGFDSQESRLVAWLKQPGDPVRRGEAIAVVESDKADIELESVADGTLSECLFDVDQVILVGSVIAQVSEAGESPEIQERAKDLLPQTRSTVEASPLARRIAAEHGIALDKISGTGPRGRITREDVEKLIISQPEGTNTNILALPKVRKVARKAGISLKDVTATGIRGNITLTDLQVYQKSLGDSEPHVRNRPIPDSEPVADGEIISLSHVQRTIGSRMVASKRKAPHFYVTGEFDLEDALSTMNVDLGINDLIQYLAVRTLKRIPELNATFQNDELRRYKSVNLAIAVARDDGLITPVIQAADHYSLEGLAAESRSLIERTRANRLQARDLAHGSFTISNLGVIKQVDNFVAIINPPQVAILAVGAVKQRPSVLNGGLHIRHTVRMTLSGDHRVVDGMVLGRFLAVFQEELDYFSSGKGS